MTGGAPPDAAALAGLVAARVRAARVRAARVWAERRRPFLLGIAGPPGSGKSTLAARLVAAMQPGHGLAAALCPMDGFHLPDAVLGPAGLIAAKGRIDTFDAPAFAAAMRRLRAGDLPFWWPGFSREREEPFAEGVRVTPAADLCVIEGNYILSDAPVWDEAAGMFDLALFIDAPDATLRARLVARHMAVGQSRAAAAARAAGNDMPNAAVARAGAGRAALRYDNGVAG